MILYKKFQLQNPVSDNFIVYKAAPRFIFILGVFQTFMISHSVWFSRAIATFLAMISQIVPWKINQTTGTEKRCGWIEISFSAKHFTVLPAVGHE